MRGMKKNVLALYSVVMVVAVAIMVTGATYAYITTSTSSSSNSVNTSSTTYKISMSILPIYNGFSLIPMNDSDVLKALGNGCKDKYDRGACFAYKILVYDYSSSLEYISGYMDIVTDNMENLSYVVLESSDKEDNDSCVMINDNTYCESTDVLSTASKTNLSLGNKYFVGGMSSKELILVMWLSNLDVSQNDTDIGSFQSTITVMAGDGGEIKGTISGAVKLGDSLEDGDGE